MEVAKAVGLRYAGPVTLSTNFAFSRPQRMARAFAGLFRPPFREAPSDLSKLRWLVRLRWLAIALFFSLAVPGVIYGFLDRTSLPRYVGLIGVLFVFNLITRFAGSPRRPPATLICFQLAFDLLILFLLLRLSGGFENPFVALFLLNVSLGAVLIPGMLGWPYLLLAHTLLGILQFESVLALPDGGFAGTLTTFLVYHGLILAFWTVLRSLGLSLERQHERETRLLVAGEKSDRLRAVGALAAGFSHEFASPLNAAKLRLERLLRANDGEDAREALEAVRACEDVIRRMNSSQLDTRDFRGHAVDPAALLREIVKTWSAENPDTPLDLVAENAGRTVLPPVNFAQVALNLFDNARDARPDGAISVRLERRDGFFSLSVSDQGPGFPPVVLEKAGEPFVTTKPQGTGLGLYVSQLFAQSLGGDLRLENTGDGARVSLFWPAPRTEPA